MTLLERVKIRCNEVDDSILNEYIETVTDRFCLRLGVEDLPERFNSICADAAIKMVRRTYYEGISSESVSNLSTSFVADILDEYNREINDYKDSQYNANGSGKVVRFL